MKKITIGIIAHVDSGKTTLSEALLYLTGTIRNFGRVDKGASFLDDDEMERRRGITIYSKQARFQTGNTQVTLIDTPGHADFSAETERALQVLDYAVLLISAADGIKGQTETLWHLLEEYQIPVFIFFNKMDQEGADRTVLYHSLQNSIARDAVDFSDYMDCLTDSKTANPAYPGDANRMRSTAAAFYDAAAVCSEEAMESFLETGSISDELIRSMISERQMFPCFFGSALKQQGVRELLMAMDRYTAPRMYPESFGARAYKIIRDPDGSRVTLLKVTGGVLKTKILLPDGAGESKINQIRLYNGNKFQLKEEVQAGEICGVTGLRESYAGQGYGEESNSPAPLLIPILSYRVILPSSIDTVKALPLFRALEEETPELSVNWEEGQQDIYVCVMGEVQLEILTSLIKERYGLDVSFDQGEVMYRETISAPVIGSGHFEPLRHYAEVHLLMEPLSTGSGLEFASSVSTDLLAKNWQRLILTHLEERQHKGVLTGSPVTDLRITLIAGKAHLKHTEGGDFRQAVYRAVRQGLMMADNVLLEPYYRFILEVPTSNVGRAMNDLNRKNAQFQQPELKAERTIAGDGTIAAGGSSFGSSVSSGGTSSGSVGAKDPVSVIRGRGPVSSLRDYPREIAVYTKGQGHIQLINDGYDICRNAEEVIMRKGYDPLADVRNTPDSVFCSHGSGFLVPYDQVYEYTDISPLDPEGGRSVKDHLPDQKTAERDLHIGTEEIEAIIARVSRSNSREKKQRNHWKKKFGSQDRSTAAVISGPEQPNPAIKTVSSRIFSLEEAEYVIVDGYNVIFAWTELAELARINIDSARDSLIDILSNFAGLVPAQVQVVFDAYRVKGHATERMQITNVQVIYTGEEETADQYIEKFTNEFGKKHRIAVVTSDGLEQIITRGQGCMLISSRDFKSYLDRQSANLRERYGIR